MNILDSILKSERDRLANTANGKTRLELLERQVAELQREPVQAQGVDDSGRFRIVQTDDALIAAIEDLSRADVISFDIETTGLDPFADTVVGFGLCANGEHGYYVPVGHDGAPGQLARDHVIEVFKPLLTTKGIVAHNAKFELMFMERLGIQLNIAFDTMIACRILNENFPASLKEAAPRILDVADWGLDLEKRPANKRSIREVGVYCIRDCLYTHGLYEKLEPMMREKFDFVFNEVELPLVPVMAKMEDAGLPVDVPYLDKIRVHVAERRESLTKEIHGAAGHEFNINSNPQLSKVLFEELNLPVTEKTDTGKPSTGAEALEKIGAAAHPIIEMILEYKGFEKLQSSYLKPDIKPATGRVHPSYFQVGTETGRMTGFGNFHPLTFPKDGVHSVSLRKAVGNVDGFSIVCADYSGQEPHEVAAYSNDKNLKATFAAGLSIHSYVAKMIYGLDEDVKSISKKSHPREYAVAKAIGLGVVYGKTAYSLAREFADLFGREVTEAEAQQFIDKFFSQFPDVKTWLDGVIARAKHDGFVDDMAGRRRHLPILKEKCARGDGETFKQQKSAEREATNFMVQALAATQTKRAMTRCHRRLAESHPRAQIIAARHDELMFLVPDDEIGAACALIKDCMENDPELEERGLTVKPEVEITFGKTWSADDQQPWDPTAAANPRRDAPKKKSARQGDAKKSVLKPRHSRTPK